MIGTCRYRWKDGLRWNHIEIQGYQGVTCTSCSKPSSLISSRCGIGLVTQGEGLTLTNIPVPSQPLGVLRNGPTDIGLRNDIEIDIAEFTRNGGGIPVEIGIPIHPEPQIHQIPCRNGLIGRSIPIHQNRPIPPTYGHSTERRIQRIKPNISQRIGVVGQP